METLGDHLYFLKFPIKTRLYHNPTNFKRMFLPCLRALSSHIKDSIGSEQISTLYGYFVYFLVNNPEIRLAMFDLGHSSVSLLLWSCFHVSSTPWCLLSTSFPPLVSVSDLALGCRHLYSTNSSK